MRFALDVWQNKKPFQGWIPKGLFFVSMKDYQTDYLTFFKAAPPA